MNILRATGEYKRRFGTAPAVLRVSKEKEALAVRLLTKAVEKNQALADGEFEKKLGLEPLPDGALI